MTSFATPEGLRDLLIRMHERESRGHFAWRLDPEAERLMRFTIRKYRWLAHNHHCEVEDSAYAAFEAMRTRAVRTAEDPWAVITRAVQVSLIAEERADGLLCATAQARRKNVVRHHDVRRFSDYETDLTECDRLFRVAPPQDEIGEDEDDETAQSRMRRTAEEIHANCVELFTRLGWPAHATTCTLNYISSRLMEAGDKRTAHNYLRRDFAGLAHSDLTHEAWSTLLRLTLGSLIEDEEKTDAGRGLFYLFGAGRTVAECLQDIDLAWEISDAAPKVARISEGRWAAWQAEQEAHGA